MYILETESSFDAAHFLAGYEGKCKNIHGHRWRVIAQISGDTLLPSGSTREMLMDFSDFKAALSELTDTFDHTLIMEENSLRPATLHALQGEGFAIRQLPCRPTAENLARLFFKALRKKGVPVVEVSVHETPQNRATWREAL